MSDQSNNQGGALTDLNTTQQQGVRNLGLLVQAILSIFPNYVGTSNSATAGAATLPANPSGFLTISVNGQTKKVPYYDE